MKIKLAILESDQIFLNRIVAALSTKYADKLEVYSFTDSSVALMNLKSIKIDVFVASDAFEIDVAQIPKHCGFAYLVGSADIVMKNEQKAISKFQKAELIYRQILSVYAEKAEDSFSVKFGEQQTKVIVFTSPCGGTGSSTMAAAAAAYFNARGKKTLYLNLEKYGSSDLYFEAQGQFGMSDLIFALKSKKANLGLKLESFVKQDKSGVCFFSKTKFALDMLELSAEEIIQLLKELKLAGGYEYVVLDLDFSVDKEMLKIQRLAKRIVWTGDGSKVSNSKIERAFQALSILEKNQENDITERICLIYNQFDRGKGIHCEIISLNTVGEIPAYAKMAPGKMVSMLSSMDVFAKLL